MKEIERAEAMPDVHPMAKGDASARYLSQYTPQDCRELMARYDKAKQALKDALLAIGVSHPRWDTLWFFLHDGTRARTKLDLSLSDDYNANTRHGALRDFYPWVLVVEYAAEMEAQNDSD
jgi:hypothetical protein